MINSGRHRCLADVWYSSPDTSLILSHSVKNCMSLEGRRKTNCPSKREPDRWNMTSCLVILL